MLFDSRYSPSDVRTFFDACTDHLTGIDKREGIGGVKIFSYYESESSIVLSPCTDTENIKKQMLQTISQGLKHLPTNIELSKKILIPVAEEQKMLWLFKRNHWVTLEYDPKTNQATLLDSRPWLLSFLYPANAMKNELKHWISSYYGSNCAKRMVFRKEYQSVQYNDTHCGAWTCRNIFDLSANTSITEQKTRYSAKDEAGIIEENMKQVGCSGSEKTIRFNLIERVLFWLGIKEKPRLENKSVSTVSPGLTKLRKENSETGLKIEQIDSQKLVKNDQSEEVCSDFEEVCSDFEVIQGRL